MSIEVLPLGAGQDVGRSCCVVRMAGRTVMFDCGAHFGFKDARRFPEFGLLSPAGRFTEIIDALIITHFHTDHIGALPYFTEVCGYRGPILMTYPTFAIAPIMLEDYVKVNADRPGEALPYNEQHVRDCLRRVTAVDLHQVVGVAPGLSFSFHYAGHVLGAAMVHMTAGHLAAVYTGDFNSSPDRHLGAAELLTPTSGPSGAPWRCPDVLISEATYAATLRDSKRARERDLLGAVVETVAAGGKVLIPTFAMGRAQELLMLITDCWERNGLQVPIYFSSAMASRALVYYQLLLNWTNANVRRAVFGGGGMADAAKPEEVDGAAADAVQEAEEGEGEGDAAAPPRRPGRSTSTKSAAVGSEGVHPPGYDRCYMEQGAGQEAAAAVVLDGNAHDSRAAAEGKEMDEDPSAEGGASSSRSGSGGDSDEEEEWLWDGSAWRRNPNASVPEPEQPRTGREGQLRRRPHQPALLPDSRPGGRAAGGESSGGGGGGGRGGNRGGAARTHRMGVFSEADVYGMFRTRPWDRSLLNAPGPALLFASPGNITSGVSLEAFRAWAGSPRNLVVLAGYQVRGTLGARLEALQSQPAARRTAGADGSGSGGGGFAPAAALEVPGGGGGGGGRGGGNSRMEVRCKVKMLAFSAHADLRGLVALVRRCRPGAVVLVHGQREPMEFLRGRIESTMGIECHAPPTGTTVTLKPRRTVPLGLRPQLVSTAACAASTLAAGAAAAAAAVAPLGVTPTTEVLDVGASALAVSGSEAAGALSQLRPQPLTALPLSGIVVARCTQDSPQQQQQLQQSQGQSQPSGSGGGGGPGGGGVPDIQARQLTLTDSTTAAHVLLKAHEALQPDPVQLRPYTISYECTIPLWLDRTLLDRLSQRPAPQGQQWEAVPPRGPHTEVTGGRGAVDTATVIQAPSYTGAAAEVMMTMTTAATKGDTAAAAAASLRHAYRALCVAVGSYSASRRLRLDEAAGCVTHGSFRARLVVPEMTTNDVDESLGGSAAGVGQDGGEAVILGCDSGEGHIGGSGAAAAWFVCEWLASDDAVATRCCQALRDAFAGPPPLAAAATVDHRTHP